MSAIVSTGNQPAMFAEQDRTECMPFSSPMMVGTSILIGTGAVASASLFVSVAVLALLVSLVVLVSLITLLTLTGLTGRSGLVGLIQMVVPNTARGV